MCFGVSLTIIPLAEAALLLQMQQAAFRPLYEKYQDEGSPYLDPLSKVEAMIAHASRVYYWIEQGGERVGAICIQQKGPGEFHLNRLFILPEWQNQGLAQGAIRLAESLYGPGIWRLDTILQEPGNCHLYEKMGYCLTGVQRRINDKMTLVDYEKILQ